MLYFFSKHNALYRTDIPPRMTLEIALDTLQKRYEELQGTSEETALEVPSKLMLQSPSSRTLASTLMASMLVHSLHILPTFGVVVVVLVLPAASTWTLPVELQQLLSNLVIFPTVACVVCAGSAHPQTMLTGDSALLYSDNVLILLRLLVRTISC